jgi:hypothetical protein
MSKYIKGVYYWKTTMDFSANDILLLQKMNVKKIYFRIFDIVYDDIKKTPAPQQPVNVVNTASWVGKLPGVSLIPVIFITQDLMQKTQSHDLPVLASNMAKLSKEIIERGKLGYSGEFQLDCDWTPTTRDKYFRLIELFRSAFNKKSNAHPEWKISTTIRLHQVKYSKNTGVPPADEFSLMAYNIKDVLEFTKEPTMFNLNELKKYLSSAQDYPQALNIILPVFREVYVYRAGRLKTVLTDVDDNELDNKKVFEKKSPGIYLCVKYTDYNGQHFDAGDVVKIETETPGELFRAMDIIEKSVRTGDTLSFYYFDGKMIGRFLNEKNSGFSDFFSNN